MLGEDLLKTFVLHVQHNVAKHLNKPAIGIVGKAGIVGLDDQAFDRPVIEAKVEDRVHHAGHGHGCPRSNRYQQRIFHIAKSLAENLLKPDNFLLELGFQTIRPSVAEFIKLTAYLGRDGEARRNRNTEIRHLRKVSSLSAQQLLHVGTTLGLALAKHIDVVGLGPSIGRLWRRGAFRFKQSSYILHGSSSRCSRQSDFLVLDRNGTLFHRGSFHSVRTNLDKSAIRSVYNVLMACIKARRLRRSLSSGTLTITFAKNS